MRFVAVVLGCVGGSDPRGLFTLAKDIVPECLAALRRTMLTLHQFMVRDAGFVFIAAGAVVSQVFRLLGPT